MSPGNESSRATVRDGRVASSAPLEARYLQASGCAKADNSAQARALYQTLREEKVPRSLAALIENDLAVLDLLDGNSSAAAERLGRALQLDPACGAARRNVERWFSHIPEKPISPDIYKEERPGSGNGHKTAEKPIRVAIVSLLFNWPSTGGGTVHTAETGKFLNQAGYEVKHFFARYADWGMGRVDEPLDYDAEPVRFENADWSAEGIRRRFREVVDGFAPDAVIITDSWNTKPLLAEAVAGYPYFLRLAALECLCPLNNVRMLFDDRGTITACPRNQLATPDICRACVQERARFSGALHQAERTLAGFDGSDYAARLRRAVADAEAVLVVNPLIAEMVRPFARRVEVIPSGFDPGRFPWPWPEEHRAAGARKQILFAGLIEEAMKGFHVLDEACRMLWSKRQDFELVATADPPDSNSAYANEYARYIGWQSQVDLPAAIRAADILAFPTVAEEALGRTAVEAMGVGRPVVAARIGGLQFTVVDGATGLLFEPGNAADLATKLERLLDDPRLCRQLGEAGRRRFEEHYTWSTIIDGRYRPLLAAAAKTAASRPRPAVSLEGVAAP